MKRLGVVVWLLGTAFALTARAQPQDDAALAEEPKASEQADSLTRWRTARGSAEPPLTTAELREAYPDLEVSATPGTRFGLFIGPVMPFQLIGLGLSGDVYVAPRFRVSSFVNFGAIKNKQESTFNVYGELSLGLVVARWRRETTIALPVPSIGSSTHTKPTGGDEPATLRGTVPVSHSLEVELGALSGYYALYRCVANCVTSDTAGPTLERFSPRQLIIPFAGLRYGYYRWARSQKTPFRSTQRFEVIGDLLLKPLNNPPRDLLNGDAKPIKQSSLGGRVTLRFPGMQTAPNAPALAFELVVGYLPSPEDVLFQFNVTVL